MNNDEPKEKEERDTTDAMWKGKFVCIPYFDTLVLKTDGLIFVKYDSQSFIWHMID